MRTVAERMEVNAFGKFREAPKQPLAHDEIEHCIAQKLQALVVFDGQFGMLVQIRSMVRARVSSVGF